MVRKKLVSPKETFKELALAAGSLKGSRDAGWKGAEGYIPCCNPLPRNTFPEGSSSPLSQSVQMCAHHIPGSSVERPGKICKSPKTKLFSRSLLKSNLQENKRDESQKSQAQVESMELLRFQPPLQILSMVAQFLGELCVSRPPHCSCCISLVAVSMGAYAQPSHRQEKPPRHHISWPHHLQDITFQRNSGKKLTCNEVCSH